VAKKIFVLDTNVILHDYNCIYNFEDNDLALPITVLEELDRFKKGSDQINFNARVFIREIDKLSTGKDIFHTGIRLGKKQGLLRIYPWAEFPPALHEIFSVDKADHHILGLAYQLHKKHRRKPVVLISKDINLRMKARAIGLTAADYENDKIDSIDTLFSGKTQLDKIPLEIINQLYKEPYHLSVEQVLGENVRAVPNQYFILKNQQSSVLAYYNPFTRRIERVESRDIFGIKGKNAEQQFCIHLLLNPEIKLVAIIGKAGTGKTLIATSSALAQSSSFKQIYLARPIIPLSNKDIGFLPGDISSKINPYMEPLYDNLRFIQNQFPDQEEHYKKIDQFHDSGKLHISPLTYIRGRSLNRIFFIVDEAQNLTPHEVKTIITRAGEGTKIVFTGDPYQIDTPYLDSESNGLSTLVSKMSGQKIFGSIRLEKGERSELAELASNIL